MEIKNDVLTVSEVFRTWGRMSAAKNRSLCFMGLSLPTPRAIIS